MSDHSKWIRKRILDLNRVRDSYVDRAGMFRMDRNERTWPHNEMVLQQIRQRLDSETLTNYTDIDGLYRKLAGYLGVSDDQIYLHSGSDLVIKSIFETFIDPGDKVLIQNPSYAMYGVYSRMYGADLVESNYDGKLHFDVEKYCEKIEMEHPKLVVFENPSGYIGNSYSHGQVKRVIETALRNDALVLVDEAYIDYIPKFSAQNLIYKYDNLIIVRTFSKAWGLAGMRAGYAVSNTLLISEVFKVMPMHELTMATVIAVDTILDYADEMKTYIEEVKAVRDYFQNSLREMGIRYIDSDTHFVTACLGEKIDADDFRIQAHKNKYFVRRPFGQDILKGWIRIGLIPMEDMREFTRYLKSYIESAERE